MSWLSEWVDDNTSWIVILALVLIVVFASIIAYDIQQEGLKNILLSIWEGE